jgi:hypothetical protein
MPRIPETELDRLKHEVSLVRLIESQGHALKKRGKDCRRTACAVKPGGMRLLAM